MDVEYGINIKNKYDFLMDDDHDPEETVQAASARAAEEETVRARAAKTAPKAATTAPADKAAANASRGGKENRGPSERGNARGAARGARGRGFAARPVTNDGQTNATPRMNARQGEQGATQDGDAPFAQRGRGGGGFGRGRGREFRGRGGMHNGFDGAPRDEANAGDQHRDDTEGGEHRHAARGFRNSRRGRSDRMSGSDKTGVKAVDKRAGGGKGNWGKAEDELEGDKEGLNVSREGAEAKEADSEPVEVVKTEEQLAEERTMTLAEYKASLLKTQQPPSQFNVRKPVDKPMKLMASKLDDVSHEEEIIVEKRAPKKQVLNIDITFAEPGANPMPGRGDYRGGRGGRGGFDRGSRGGAGRGFDNGRGRGGNFARGGRGGFAQGQRYGRQDGALKVDDLESFPELG